MGFARLTDRIGKAILRGTYRTSAAVWELGEEVEEPEVSIIAPYLEEEQQRPYFELLVVRDGVREDTERRVREDMRRARRPEDPFIYEPVLVSTFEDAVIAVLFNPNIQAVVIYDGFQFRSASNVPALGTFLQDRLGADGKELPEEDHATALAAAVARIRPELDVYMLTDQAVESLAGDLVTRNIRRIFYDVEELLELHLAILDGVNDRYETPYFDNLKKYSRRAHRHVPRPADRSRQVGVPVQLDPGHGAFLRRQHFPCRVLGHHGRPRQPARADREHQEGPGKGRARASGRSRRSSAPTAPRPRTRSSCRACSGPATSS